MAQDFRRSLGTWNHLRYLDHSEVIRLVELREGETFTLGTARIRPFPLAQAGMYGSLFKEGRIRALIIPDDLLGWEPSAEFQGADVAVIPMGVVEFDPFTGERHIPAEHPVLEDEATFRETLELVPRLAASRVVMTYIEEPDDLTDDDLQGLSGRLQQEGLPVVFAYDTMLVDV